jgi:hypothetical protein
MNLLEFDQEYKKLFDKVRTEDLRTIKVFITKSSGDIIFGLMKDEDVIDYFKVTGYDWG